MTLNIQIKNIQKEFNRINIERENTTKRQFNSKVIRIFNDIKVNTPILTGRARNSWNVSLNPNSNIDTKKGETAFNPITVLSSAKVDNTIYLSNGVPYIQYLNNGSSKQAPKRFIEKAIIRNL